MRNEFTLITGEEALAELVKIINRYDVGRLALFGEDFPYMLPINHAYLDGKLIMHGSFKGKKIDLMRRNSKACYEVDGPRDGNPKKERSCHLEYESVLCYGSIKELGDCPLKYEYLDHQVATLGQAAVDHGKMKNTNCFVFEITEMTGRTGRFHPDGERPLYIYRFIR